MKLPLLRQARNAFSLIEVVLALGVVSFALTSIIGLLSFALTTGRQAENDTAMTAMKEFVSSSIRADKFATLQAASSYFFAFDVDGNCLLSTNAAELPSLPASTYYTCMAATNSASASNILSFSIIFTWPPHVNNSTNASSISVANYD